RRGSLGHPRHHLAGELDLTLLVLVRIREREGQVAAPHHHETVDRRPKRLIADAGNLFEGDLRALSRRRAVRKLVVVPALRHVRNRRLDRVGEDQLEADLLFRFCGARETALARIVARRDARVLHLGRRHAQEFGPRSCREAGAARHHARGEAAAFPTARRGRGGAGGARSRGRLAGFARLFLAASRHGTTGGRHDETPTHGPPFSPLAAIGSSVLRLRGKSPRRRFLQKPKPNAAMTSVRHAARGVATELSKLSFELNGRTFCVTRSSAYMRVDCDRSNITPIWPYTAGAMFDTV